MELIQDIENFTAAVYALRWVIAIPFAVIGGLCAWGWWNNITV